MASGLVPITSDVGAVSEFVDHECGILTEGESFAQLADAVEALYQDPARFLRLSANAAERVRRQSGPEQTTKRELRILRATAAAGGLRKSADQ
jgi:glycosyltransferase involved in cell wall biosynthesis